MSSINSNPDLTQVQAIGIIIQAVNIGINKEIYNENELVILEKCISKFTEKPSDENASDENSENNENNDNNDNNDTTGINDESIEL